MSGAAAALSIGSGVFGALGALRQGAAARAAGKFQQKVMKQQAASERSAARAEAEDLRISGSRARASSLARLGASGVDVSGSPLMVDEAFVRDVALQSARALHGGQVRGQRLEQQGKLARFAGNNARTASFFGAGSSLLSGLRGAIG